MSKRLVTDVIKFIDTGEFPEEIRLNALLREEFIEELDIQEQLNDTELDSGIPIGSLE